MRIFDLDGQAATVEVVLPRIFQMENVIAPVRRPTLAPAPVRPGFGARWDDALQMASDVVLGDVPAPVRLLPFALIHRQKFANEIARVNPHLLCGVEHPPDRVEQGLQRALAIRNVGVGIA